MENRFDDKKFHGWKPDWSKHKLIIKKYTSEEDGEITEYILKKPDTSMEMVVFCNHSGILSNTSGMSCSIRAIYYILYILRYFYYPM